MHKQQCATGKFAAQTHDSAGASTTALGFPANSLYCTNGGIYKSSYLSCPARIVISLVSVFDYTSIRSLSNYFLRHEVNIIQNIEQHYGMLWKGSANHAVPIVLYSLIIASIFDAI